jgi:hypothetical protein
MHPNSCTTEQTANPVFDLFRLSRSKECVDVSPNTLRAYHAEGLTFYQRKGDRAVWVSRTELANFIRKHKMPKPDRQ